MEMGWIKLHRKIQDCFIWNDKPYDKARAWVDLLLLASHKDKRMMIDNEIFVIEKGSLMTSILKLSDRWGWSRNKVLRFLNVLESEQMLNTKRTTKGTLVTIIKYGDYQLGDTTDDTTVDTTVGTSDETTDEPQNKNVKNVRNNNIYNNINNNIYCSNFAEEEKADKKAQQEELKHNFKIIYDSYPKKVGRAKGFDYYKGWLKGRDISGQKIKLTNKQIWSAIANYKHQLEENNTERQFIKNFDTFMNKAILDYVEEQ